MQYLVLRLRPVSTNQHNNQDHRDTLSVQRHEILHLVWSDYNTSSEEGERHLCRGRKYVTTVYDGKIDKPNYQSVVEIKDKVWTIYYILGDTLLQDKDLISLLNTVKVVRGSFFSYRVNLTLLLIYPGSPSSSWQKKRRRGDNELKSS